MNPPRLRCAIYTRKSSEEGLEQGFNSLDAQREACEAYIRSQLGEGWVQIPVHYDDGGFSGGTMNRPALAQLLGDIEARRVDVVVVYKVDRLTRSLSDFARMVEVFDRQGASFVSVTQAFNTTSSMGRLTLNVLLSFAQFEREVTGERIRDKIAASKAKGMWMGGNVPLGFDIPIDPMIRALSVNPVEAEVVRSMFQLYLELGTVRRLAVALRERGITTKMTMRNGRPSGARPWQEGALYPFLRNRIYRGDIVHKGAVHPGLHDAIVDASTFDAVQARLDQNAPVKSERQLLKALFLFTDHIFDDAGHHMSPVCARRTGRLHRYYVSQATIRRDRGEPGSLPRVQAPLIEELVRAELATRYVGDVEMSDVIERIVVSRAGLSVHVRPRSERERPLAINSEEESGIIHMPVNLRMVGGRQEAITATGAPAMARRADDALIRAIARGRRWEAQLAGGERTGADNIAAAEQVPSRYVDTITRLAWLAPDLVERIVAGERLQGMTLTDLRDIDLPREWEAQRRALELG